MATHGYYRYPTIHEGNVVFVSEDDLWSVPVTGGVARRLTAGLGEVSHPWLSPDGQWLAFVGREEGTPEVYVMPAEGGPARRMTFLGATALRIAGWSADCQSVWFASNAQLPFPRGWKLSAVPRDGGQPEPLPYGPAANISVGPAGQVVLGRHTHDPARWKRYRGGTCGQLWIDDSGEGQFRPLSHVCGNLASPMWVGQRIYFLSDHEGIANLYSCLPSGEDVRRHTDHHEYFARNASTDGQRIVYHSGGNLFVYDPREEQFQPIAVEFLSPRTQRSRKFVSAAKHLETARLHPQGHSVAVTTRGRAYVLGNWDGPAIPLVVRDGIRHRLASWLPDGKRMVLVTDENGEETLSIGAADGSGVRTLLPPMELGRPIDLQVSPASDYVAIANHRGELIVVDLGAGTSRVVDRSRHGRLLGVAWSPDGQWLAYGCPETNQTSRIKLAQVSDGTITAVTEPVLRDAYPSFDPDGKYLYFLSHRVFDPVYDNLQFDLNFPRGMKPFLVTLQRETTSPFRQRPSGTGDKPAASASGGSEKPESSGQPAPIRIDLEGISERLIPFPIAEGKYSNLRGLPKGRVLFLSHPVEGSLKQDWSDLNQGTKATLEVYDLQEQKQETWHEEVLSVDLAADGQSMVIRTGQRLRVLKTSDKPKSDATRDPPGRKSGWVALDRIKVSVVPPAEWRQMFREAWRLQREHFWVEDMSAVDWLEVYNRYLPLLDRIGTRSEFSDLIWEMQGELGTSHAYEMGGDYRQPPRYQQGFLGADFVFDAEQQAYRVTRIVAGDGWDDGGIPLRAPGVNVAPGDLLLAINGRQLDARLTPAEALVHLAGTEVLLAVRRGDEPPRLVAVTTLKNETPARYREWVDGNRRLVHEITAGRVGYVHIPNMGPSGYAEFHRGYLAECQRDGLIVDVRYNGGGHVSQLILEKLTRRRLGYSVARWSAPEPYPDHSVRGPLVAITNELAGSDGDIFSHCFKMLKLGPLIGKRTWGGVIGIWPRHALMDGGITTQPEFSFWFSDVGWGVENFGTAPDIEVEVAPQDDQAGRDPQLLRGVSEILRLLDTSLPPAPAFDQRPQLTLPKLPGRG